MSSLSRLVVTTDGSCLGNPGPAGWAWALSESVWCAGANPRTTNNLMELRAVYEALKALPASRPLVIQTDSQYVISVFTEWMNDWISRGWRTAARKPVANKANIELIAQLLTGRDVEWKHVRGHQGHLMNEFVDRRAHAAATAQKNREPIDEGPGFAASQGDEYQ